MNFINANMRNMHKVFLCVLVLLLTGCQSRVNSETPSNSETAQNSSHRILVAYFSCTGNTKQIAELIADVTGATLYQITPETPYTTADLDYRNSSSRSSVENNDPSARPAISGSVENMENYDIVFLGYPIWFGQAPKIISTFLESYDFSNKTIVPFCTSGSSGVGSSDTNLHRLCANSVNWKPGRRIPSNASRATVSEWIDSLNIISSNTQ